MIIFQKFLFGEGSLVNPESAKYIKHALSWREKSVLKAAKKLSSFGGFKKCTCHCLAGCLSLVVKVTFPEATALKVIGNVS